MIFVFKNKVKKLYLQNYKDLLLNLIYQQYFYDIKLNS